MELTLKSIKQFFRRGSGVTTFVSSVGNGYLYTFVGNMGKNIQNTHLIFGVLFVNIGLH